jgi:hypothetical protein
VFSVMPKTRTRWTGSAVWRASSRMRSCRSRSAQVPEILDHLRPEPARLSLSRGGPETGSGELASARGVENGGDEHLDVVVVEPGNGVA